MTIIEDTDTDTVTDRTIKIVIKKKKSSLPLDFNISDRVRKWAMENNMDHLEDHLEYFKRSCEAKGYEYVSWDAAFMNAIRNDWAKIGGKSNGTGNIGRSGATVKKAGRAESDGKPYPVDHEF